MRRTLRLCVLAALWSGVAGCFELDFGGAFGPGLSGSGCSFVCVDFGIISQGNANILVGGAVPVTILSTSGRDQATWRTSAAALLLLTESGAPLSDTVLQRTAVVKGVQAGRGTIHATAADATFRDSLAIRVVDSSAIQRLEILAPPNPTIRVGDQWQLSVLLYDAIGAVAGSPTSVAISDTTVLRKVTEPASLVGDRVILAGRAAGSSLVTVRFQQLEKSVSFTVTP